MEIEYHEGYRIPKIEEFHEGFVYEEYVAGSGDDYVEKRFSLLANATFIGNVYKNNLQAGWVRVKK